MPGGGLVAYFSKGAVRGIDRKDGDAVGFVAVGGVEVFSVGRYGYVGAGSSADGVGLYCLESGYIAVVVIEGCDGA